MRLCMPASEEQAEKAAAICMFEASWVYVPGAYMPMALEGVISKAWQPANDQQGH